MRKIYQTNAFLKDNKNPKFYTSAGWLTLYSLACGYMEKYLVNNYEILMYQDGCFHVIVRHNNSRISWDSFNTVTQARVSFLKAIRQAINMTNTTDRIYLGTITGYGRIYLLKHSWDCNWYWGFGYLGNSKFHYHFSSYLPSNYNDCGIIAENPTGFKHDWCRLDYIFKETWLKQDDWWLLLELFEQTYRLKKAAEVYRRGAGISYVKDITNQLVSESVHTAINKDLEKVLDTIWNYLLTARKGHDNEK